MTSVEVASGSRLHFGLTRVGSREGKYAGIGVMIEQPVTRLLVRPAVRFNAPGSSRLERMATAWLAHLNRSGEALQMELVDSPPRHSGLGSGTQLAQAIAAGVNRCASLPDPHVLEVARVLDRGQRSMIGSFGFRTGGLVVDRVDGVPGDSATLAESVSLPQSWQVVLVRHLSAVRTWGAIEREAFEKLKTATSEGVTLERVIDEGILPAARAADFDGFSDAVFEYGRQSGLYYREIQGGPWNGPAITAIVKSLREWHISGVGQSSWGPVVFGWCKDPSHADQVARQTRDRFAEEVDVSVARVRNEPARVRQFDQDNLTG